MIDIKLGEKFTISGVCKDKKGRTIVDGHWIGGSGKGRKCKPVKQVVCQVDEIVFTRAPQHDSL